MSLTLNANILAKLAATKNLLCKNTAESEREDMVMRCTQAASQIEEIIGIIEHSPINYARDNMLSDQIIHIIKEKLDIGRGAASILLHILERPDVVNSRVEIALMTKLSESSVTVFLTSVRNRLKQKGIQGAISTVWRDGYIVSKDYQEKILALLSLTQEDIVPDQIRSFASPDIMVSPSLERLNNTVA